MGRQDTEVRQADYLTQGDLTTLLATAERICSREYPMFLVMATGGLRIGEAIGLQVGDIDVVGQQIHVRRAVRRGYIASPKNGKGRTVDMPPTTMSVLEQLRETRQVEAAYQGKEARWLFPQATGGSMPETASTVQKSLRRALLGAGIRPIRPHDLRHTYATLAIQAGVDLLTVSRQLGHASISTTANLYVHAVPGKNRAAAEALEAVLTRNQTQPPRNPPG